MFANSRKKKHFSFFLFQWRYSIRIENIGLKTVQLAERHFRIVSNSGVYEQVKAKGICISIFVLYNYNIYSREKFKK